MYKGCKCPMANALSEYFLPQLEIGLCGQRRVLGFTFPEELWAADLRDTEEQLDFSFYNCTRTSQLR